MSASYLNNCPRSNGDGNYTVAAFYKFVRIDDAVSLRSSLTQLCSTLKILGTILVASEGINGTIAGAPDAIEKIFQWFHEQFCFQGLEVKYSVAIQLPFHRLKVRLKNEIVSMGQPTIDPNSSVGTYVKAEDWNELIQNPKTIIVDTRNHYEVEIGSFKNSINPNTNSFRDFPRWVETTLKEMPNANKSSKIAMFCTGGIRCEKATSYLKQQGYTDVYHLEGGILKYLEQIKETNSLWHGECFVFDNRVSVKQNLLPGSFKMCHACRMPLNTNDLSSKKYSPGVSCPKCYGNHTVKQERRFRDRQQQMELAKLRGEQHLGAKAKSR